MYNQRTITAEEICRKLRPIFGDKIDKLYFNYITSESKESKEEMFSILTALYQKHFDKLLDSTTLLEPPKSEDVQGNYKIGNVAYFNKEIYPFSLRDVDFPRHICVTGMSGSGKTTLALNILDSLIQNKKAFLVFDWKKSFRPLIAKDSTVTCFTVGDNSLTNKLKMNINRPPKGVSPKEWITVICDLIAESFFVSYGVHKVLLETLDDSFKEWGIYKGSENYPTWHHIKWRLEEKLEKAKSREAGWIESALRVATVLTFGDFGEVLNYKGEDSINVEDILNKRVVLEMNSLGNIEKKFFCEFILMYIYKLKKVKQNRIDKGFDYAILVDEAHNIFLKDKTRFVSESVTDMVYREMREYGTSLICLDQHISKLSDTVKGNSACHIAFQQQLPEDIDAVSRLMHLWDNKEFFSRLEVGQGVVKLSDRYTRPFFIRAEKNDIRGIDISDNEIRSRVKRFFNNQEFEKGEDIKFNSDLISGGKFDINTLFKNIILPKTLPLHAKNTNSQETNEPISEPAIETIYATIKRRIRSGEKLNEIEKQMEMIYNPQDVMHAVNRIMEEELKETAKFEEVIEPKSEVFEVKIPEAKSLFEIPRQKNYEKKQTEDKKEKKIPNEKAYKASLQRSNNYIKLDVEESKFIAFLLKNPTHELTTVNLYKKIGFSPRKGNKIKNQLIEKRLLATEEIKYEKGWKKIIRFKENKD